MPSNAPGHRLAEIPLFAALDPSTRDTLAAEGRVRRYPAGQILCSEGDPGDELLVLEAGEVRISRFTIGGLEVVLAEEAAPVAFGELALIDGGARTASVTATTDVEVRYLPREAVMGLFERDPAVAIAMMRGMAAMVRAIDERLSDLVSLDAPGRLAKWLLRHADDQGRVVLTGSQEELAHSIGTTRVTVNRSLRRFARLGLITMHGQEVHLRNVPALRSMTEG
jgi:CRP/FNR family transcriptional regulator, cyclic AMP receptor protein